MLFSHTVLQLLVLFFSSVIDNWQYKNFCTKSTKSLKALKGITAIKSVYRTVTVHRGFQNIVSCVESEIK